MYLILSGITKRFDKRTVVDNINLDIRQGELVTLLGPSGCGKTTTLRMIGGFIKPTSGSILLDGLDITLVPSERRPVTTVFQSYALFPHMTVMENVQYGLRYKRICSKKEARKKAEEILNLVNLDEFVDRKVTNLSGGQQQRVGLARALVLNPKVLLLDEPLSNLDAKLRLRIRKEIKDIQRKLGTTMLFVTHDQEEALSLSDRIIVMNEGRIEQIGTPKSVYTQSKNEFVADFIGRANILGAGLDLRIIRPENFVPAESGLDYQGNIVQKQYRGSFTTYFIDIGQQVIQMDLSSFEDQGWDIGQNIGLRIREQVLAKIPAL